MKSFEIEEVFNVSPEELYNAWLSSEVHSIMTGGEAECSNIEGGGFSAWDGYITGKNVKLTYGKEIVQQWRTIEFKDSDLDSELIIRFNKITGGCKLILVHNDIPDGQPDYNQGWEDNYFIPMKEYFHSA
jgi:activator of HSP90 ATPase